MAGSDQSFFTVFRELAKKLDNLPNQTNILTKSEKKLQSLQYIKELSENLNNNVLECNNLQQSLQNSYVQFRSITDLTSMILEQQKTIIKEQESFLEEHGYIPYQKQQSIPSKTKDEEEEDNPIEEKEFNTPESVTNNDNPHEKESPQTPQLKDFGLSHYTLALLQKPTNICNSYNDSYSNYNNNNCVSTPAGFQHNGLFMSPGVLGRIPPLFTPVTGTLQNDTKLYKTPSYLNLTSYSSQKKARIEEKMPSHSIRKKLEMPINEEMSTKPSPEPLQFNNSNSQQYLESGVSYLPPTPQLENKKTLVNYSRNYNIDELPAPPNLITRTLRSHTSKSGHCSKSVDPQKPETPASESMKEVNLPTPPLLHTTFISTEPGSVCKYSKSFLSNSSAFLASDKDNLAEIDFIPKAPKLNLSYESKHRRIKSKKQLLI